MFVVVPATFCIHLVSVGITLSGYESGTMAAFQAYFRPDLDVCQQHIVSYIYFRSAPYMLLLSGLAVLLGCLNALTDGVYLQTGGCIDPLVQTSIASASYKHVTSQWMWCIGSFSFTCMVTLFVERLRSVNLVAHATQVHNVLATIASLAKSDNRLFQNFERWRTNAGVSVSQWHFGRLYFYILFLLLLMVSATPSVGYVLAQVLCWMHQVNSYFWCGAECSSRIGFSIHFAQQFSFHYRGQIRYLDWLEMAYRSLFVVV